MLLAVVALVDAAKQLPDSLHTSRTRVEAKEGLPLVQRELAPAKEHGMNQQLLLRAAEILPRDAVFSFAGDARASGAPFFYAYWLLPRRHTADPAAADWIVSWGAYPSRLGVKVAVVADLGSGAKVLRVQR